MLVSVVVPTYRSGEGLDRVIASLDAQTMPTSDFEVLFVDDGSPDDTFERLQAIAADRPHVRVEQIEGSGWASRPRNVGTDLARGEYVLFMDHDDELWPDALERAYALGAPHGADVINPKEVRSRGWNWGLDVWQRDRIVTGDDLHVKLIYPMTPHKLYRTAFLREHGIRFREGSRILWEDIYFNTEVYAHTQVMALYGSAPFYHWMVGTGANNSATFSREADEWWDNIERVVDYAGSGIVQGDDRRFLLSHQYTGRVLAMFTKSLRSRDEAFQEVTRRRAVALVQRAIPTEVDDQLPAFQRARAELLRAGELDALARLVEVDGGAVTAPTVTDLAWDGRELVVSTRTPWVRGGEPFAFRREGDRLLRDLPGVEDRLSDHARDVTTAVPGATSRVSVRDRDTLAGWMVPTVSTVEVGEGPAATVTVMSVARVPVDGSDTTPSLLGATWDLSVRSALAGMGEHRRLEHDGGSALALVDGTVVVAYANKTGVLSIDTGERVRRLLSSTGVVASKARAERAGGGRTRLVLPLKRVHVVGTTRLDCEVVLRPQGHDGTDRDHVVPAEVVADADGARVEATVAVPRGSWDVLLRRGERTKSAKVGLTAGLLRRASLTR
ncbi:MAG: glycosyltransferase [Nocardioidaceae bacterium]|nr:glycosyltransferase [Nocardioidaceae bacterium]